MAANFATNLLIPFTPISTKSAKNRGRRKKSNGIKRNFNEITSKQFRSNTNNGNCSDIEFIDYPPIKKRKLQESDKDTLSRSKNKSNNASFEIESNNNNNNINNINNINTINDNDKKEKENNINNINDNDNEEKEYNINNINNINNKNDLSRSIIITKNSLSAGYQNNNNNLLSSNCKGLENETFMQVHIKSPFISLDLLTKMVNNYDPTTKISALDSCAIKFINIFKQYHSYMINNKSEEKFMEKQIIKIYKKYINGEIIANKLIHQFVRLFVKECLAGVGDIYDYISTTRQKNLFEQQLEKTLYKHLTLIGDSNKSQINKFSFPYN